MAIPEEGLTQGNRRVDHERQGCYCPISTPYHTGVVANLQGLQVSGCQEPWSLNTVVAGRLKLRQGWSTGLGAIDSKFISVLQFLIVNEHFGNAIAFYQSYTDLYKYK